MEIKKIDPFIILHQLVNGSSDWKCNRMHKSLEEVLMIHIDIVYQRITLFPLCGRKKIKEPANIGKTTIIVKPRKMIRGKDKIHLGHEKSGAQNKIQLF